MKVYDLMMLLAQSTPYAEVGVLWDGCVADIDHIETDGKGVVILVSADYASLDLRMRGDILDE